MIQLVTLMVMGGLQAPDSDLWVSYPGAGDDAPHVVLIAGDEEYRSEEALPQLGKILSVHHGVRCTVLFPIDPASGEICPTCLDNIPGLEALETADLMVIATRFRDLPDEQIEISPLKDSAYTNIVDIRVSALKSQLLRSWLKDVAFQNMEPVRLTLLVFQLLSG